jgi:hypothetical protein
MWKLYIMESERGWGQRVDEILKFDTYEEADKYKKEFNSKNNLPEVPDWYMYADGPVKVD